MELPKSYVLPLFGIKEELKLATMLSVSPVSLPTVICPSILTLPLTNKLDAVISPDAEIPPFKYSEPVFSSSNFAKVMGFPSPTEYCNESGPLFTYNSPSNIELSIEPEPLLN